MDFKQYVKELCEWNDNMRELLETENGEHEDLWENLNELSDIMESISGPLSTEDLVALQSKAEIIHAGMENYLERKQDPKPTQNREGMVKSSQHTLPPLPYDYSALEPFISKEIMELHHDKHHRSYVDGLNKAESQLALARKTGDFTRVKQLSRELAFHGSGHYLHTIFWNNMTPTGTGYPSMKLLKEIESYFGSFEVFKNHFSEAAKQVEGSGWALLVWSPRSRHLEVLQTESHTHYTQWDTIPLLVLDVWEHAYYLQYKNNRAEYIKNWWKIVNWDDVAARFESARSLKWAPY